METLRLSQAGFCVHYHVCQDSVAFRKRTWKEIPRVGFAEPERGDRRGWEREKGRGGEKGEGRRERAERRTGKTGMGRREQWEGDRGGKRGKGEGRQGWGDWEREKQKGG